MPYQHAFPVPGHSVSVLRANPLSGHVPLFLWPQQRGLPMWCSIYVVCNLHRHIAAAQPAGTGKNCQLVI